MVNDWEEMRLDEVTELIIDCPHSTPKWMDEGVAVLRSNNIKNGRLDLSSPSFTNEEGYQARVKRAIPESGDLVLTREAPMGEVCQIPEGLRCCLGQRMVLLRVKKEIMDSTFLLFALQSPYLQHQISWNEGTGTTVSNIRMPNIKAFQIPTPPLPEQKAIAHILGSLDDKIELNRQMNETLEAMAQALFKSWFVDFDPVIDNALAAGNAIPDEFIERAEQRKGIEKKDNSDIQGLFPDAFEFTEEMGWIPKGWAVSNVGTEFNTVGGGTPSTKNSDFWENGDISWTTPKDLSGNQSKILLNTDRKITELGLNKISSGLLPIDTVLMSSRAPVGYLALAKVPVAINQGYIALKCEKILTPEFAIQWADSAMDEIKQRAGGTTFAEISKTNFRGIPILVPSRKIIDAYSRDVKDLYNQITSRIENINSLAKLRDTLLPKLMSGELRISDAAELVDEAV